jgi:hypothetical protein
VEATSEEGRGHLAQKVKGWKSCHVILQQADARVNASSWCWQETEELLVARLLVRCRRQIAIAVVSGRILKQVLPRPQFSLCEKKCSVMYFYNNCKQCLLYVLYGLLLKSGLDSVVFIATRYRLDGRGIESWWGKILRTRPDLPRSLPYLLYGDYGDTYPGVKRLGRGIDLPPRSSAEVEETVELYFYSFSMLPWHIARSVSH